MHSAVLSPAPTWLIYRWLALAIEHPDWSPTSHPRFMPSFRAAARTLLLAAQRGTMAAGAGSSATAAEEGSGAEPQLSWAGLLASLPPELLLRIVGLAAYPLSTWAPLDAAATVSAMKAAMPHLARYL